MYQGTNNNERKNLDKMKIHAQQFANKIQKNVIIYEVTERGQGTYFQFKEDEGEKKVKARIKFIRHDKSQDVLQDNGNRKRKSSNAEKKGSNK